MRYVVYGAGAVGCIVGGKALMSGLDVVLIARGEHLETMRRDGLRLRHPNPEATETLSIPLASHPSEITFGPEDVVLLTMKSQDTVAALQDLRYVAGDEVPVVCCQNGVENERQALRRFRSVYGVLLVMAAEFVRPGEVVASSWPAPGVFDIGRYPEGKDALCEAVAADMSKAGFISEANARVMRLKYTKLHQNMVNAVQALFDPGADTSDILAKLRAEAEACYAAAGIDWASSEETLGRMAATGGPPPGIGGAGWRGGSTWQSLIRGSGNSETDYLNGEIILLGHLHNVPTPANEVVQIHMDRIARSRGKPGSVALDELRAQIAAREAAYKT